MLELRSRRMPLSDSVYPQTVSSWSQEVITRLRCSVLLEHSGSISMKTLEDQGLPRFVRFSRYRTKRTNLGSIPCALRQRQKGDVVCAVTDRRSEERRVGKECSF